MKTSNIKTWNLIFKSVTYREKQISAKHKPLAEEGDVLLDLGSDGLNTRQATPREEKTILYNSKFRWFKEVHNSVHRCRLIVMQPSLLASIDSAPRNLMSHVPTPRVFFAHTRGSAARSNWGRARHVQLTRLHFSGSRDTETKFTSWRIYGCLIRNKQNYSISHVRLVKLRKLLLQITKELHYTKTINYTGVRLQNSRQKAFNSQRVVNYPPLSSSFGQLNIS